jgi:hypothetical protein
VVSARVGVEYAVVIVGDPSTQEIPRFTGSGVVVSNGRTVAIGCRPDVDGETTFTLGTTEEVAPPGVQPNFIGRVPTPSRRVTIQSATTAAILEIAVPLDETVIRVWVNDSAEPGQVIVGLDSDDSS